MGIGPEAILQAAEIVIVIVTENGRRHRVEVPKGPPEMKKPDAE